MSIYQLKLGAVEVTLVALGQVLALLNASPKDTVASRPTNLRDISVLRDGSPMQVTRNEYGHLGVQQEGAARDLLLAMIDEVDRHFVRPQGQVRAPHEMSRLDWEAVAAIGSAAFNVFPCFTVDQLHERFASGPGMRADMDLSDLCRQEMEQRWGYGHLGPRFADRSTNVRHEVHVAAALFAGKSVPEEVIAEYRDGYARHCADDDPSFALVLELPQLRGRLSEAQLRGLEIATRRSIMIDSGNVERLIAEVSSLPVDATYVDVDDRLYSAGLLPALSPENNVPGVDTSVLTSPVARDLYDALATAQAKSILERAQRERDKGNISKREYERQCAVADAARNSFPTRHCVEFAASVASRDVKPLLLILDSSEGMNEASKRVFTRHTGVKIRGLNKAARRAAIFTFCGYDEARRQAYERDLEAAHQKRLADEAAERATAKADASTINTPTGKVSARQYVDAAVTAGYKELVNHRKGKVSWWLYNESTGNAYPLSAADGTLDYARDGLRLPVREAKPKS
ncbi:hypothetical protein [Burkholderia sp. Ac-20365]|uniref:hypothetical protein n=1 Tax=Burkholderia sp. Ac-20365 TaxID=2703897 RepID=UPI00197B21FA|nr:hypothetical protein [Burkholderia sp. Ac-20365]MBN3760917.1 hypothetical protein [Burkholderia sp. Ac-20365]